MLLWLAKLSNWISALNIFQYTTFRAVMAALTALAFSLMLGPWTIRKLTELKAGQAIRSDGPKTHLAKAGTPTMGGVLILVSITVSTLLWGNVSHPYIWILLGVLLGTGALGFYDDWRKVVYKDPHGVSAKFKMVWQSSVALAAGVLLFYVASNSANNILIVPFFKQVALPLGVVGGRRDGGVCLCHGALAVCTLFAAALRAGGERGDGILRGHVRRVFGLFMVQRGTGAGIYGRRGRVGAGRGAGHGGGNRAPGICVGDYGRAVCGGSFVGDAAGGLV